MVQANLNEVPSVSPQVECPVEPRISDATPLGLIGDGYGVARYPGFYEPWAK